jgi:hypothetical protein
MSILNMIDKARRLALEGRTLTDICLIAQCHPNTAAQAIKWAQSQVRGTGATVRADGSGPNREHRR